MQRTRPRWARTFTLPPSLLNSGRAAKGHQVLCVLKEHLGSEADIAGMRCLDVGCGGGQIAGVMAGHVGWCVGVDLDTAALEFSRRSNPVVPVACADAQRLPFADGAFDIVICNHVYEHVPSAEALMAEIRRVLSDDGVCYFAAGNRLWPLEVHYKLPFLSWLPSRLADFLVRKLRSHDRYDVRLRTRAGLRRLLRGWKVTDYTQSVLRNPGGYRLGLDNHPDQALLVRIAAHAPRFIVAWFSATWLLVLEPNHRAAHP